jgi:hypothetical protein
MLIVRRLRGILATALIWAVPWAVLGAVAVVAVDAIWRAPGFHAIDSFAYTRGLFLDALRVFAQVGARGGAALPLLVGVGALLTGAPAVLGGLVTSGIGASLGAGAPDHAMSPAIGVGGRRAGVGGRGAAASPSETVTRPDAQ